MEPIKVERREIVPGQMIDTVSARELWYKLESKQQFADWIKNRIEKYGFIEGVDYLVHKVMNNPVGGRPDTEYHITVNVAKELAMVENNAKGREVRRYFIECEKLARAKAAVPSTDDLLQQTLNDPGALRKLLLDNVEKVIALQAEVSEMKPTVAAFDKLATSICSLCLTDAAKTLQMRPIDLTTWMSTNGWIYRRQGTSWLAYQDHLKNGQLEHKVTTITRPNEPDKIVSQVRVTAKGLTALSKLLSQPVMDI